ncbi:glutaminyl-tRNA synthetase [Candidatus Magnetoovum chiemensis]|nr:glutaminyl-tRNA synthetase [Candidatus Magnetoovum chiemensis]
MTQKEPEAVSNFIRTIIEADLKNKKHDTVITRFPPEPNGYLHIGHAKSICLNFGLALDYNGRCHLRFDDTNPSKEDEEFVESIQNDVKWLGFDWAEHLYFASDYFDKLYEYALELIKKGKAYICSLDQQQIRQFRGTLTEPGKESPYRSRSVEENLDLFRRMKEGEFEESQHVVRAKIDMNSPNINMRDPVIYRIMKVPHHRTGNKWRIYPMYDYTHCLSDAIEGITHSICTLEFEDHRPLYDWCLNELNTPCHPQQIEFARLNLSYTVLSKRKLHRLVEEHHVCGWDDPRMPTLSGMRRRGYPPQAIKRFCERIGVSKRDSFVDITLFEYYIRDELNKTAKRVMAVIRPLKVVITNYPDNETDETLEAVNNPEDQTMGTRNIHFSKTIYIEQEDFQETPHKKFYRLSPGSEVRLRYAYYIKCTDIIKDKQTGAITEIHCTYDPQTRGGYSPDGRKVKSTIHWVCANKAIKAQVRLYNYLFTKTNPEETEDGKDFLTENINPNSLEILDDCYLEPSLKNALPGETFQFERLGYFCLDIKDTTDDKLVFNQTITLRDTWQKIQKNL